MLEWIPIILFAAIPAIVIAVIVFSFFFVGSKGTELASPREDQF